MRPYCFSLRWPGIRLFYYTIFVADLGKLPFCSVFFFIPLSLSLSIFFFFLPFLFSGPGVASIPRFVYHRFTAVELRASANNFDRFPPDSETLAVLLINKRDFSSPTTRFVPATFISPHGSTFPETTSPSTEFSV